jgi:hypothetical protein
MCTVTFIARRNGYALGMNRDEKLTRVQALPPARYRLGHREALFPAEPNGGTWIGVNDAGVTFALINWYSVTAHVNRQAISRGETVKSALPSASPPLVDAALAEAPLLRVNPFRLIGVFPASQSVIEWRWDLDQLERVQHPWQTHTWISSGFDEPRVQRARGAHFAKALHQTSAGSLTWLRRLHRSHTPERGPYSTCMHRADAATVSYTEIIVGPQMARMHYLSDAPCCGTPHCVSRLELGQSAASGRPGGRHAHWATGEGARGQDPGHRHPTSVGNRQQQQPNRGVQRLIHW